MGAQQGSARTWSARLIWTATTLSWAGIKLQWYEGQDFKPLWWRRPRTGWITPSTGSSSDPISKVSLYPQLQMIICSNRDTQDRQEYFEKPRNSSMPRERRRPGVYFGNARKNYSVTKDSAQVQPGRRLSSPPDNSASSSMIGWPRATRERAKNPPMLRHSEDR